MMIEMMMMKVMMMIVMMLYEGWNHISIQC